MLWFRRVCGEIGGSERKVSSDGCGDIVPMRDWIKGEGKVCRPCVLPLLASWYVSELDETGNKNASEQIRQLAEKPSLTPEEMATELDNVKASVDAKVSTRLREFDCAIQKNE